MTGDALTALSALQLAFGIVKSPCSAAETQRAEVLLRIAREIREEQQYRSSISLRADLARAKLGAPIDVQPASTPLRAGGIVSAPPGFAAAVVGESDVTITMPALAEQTQAVPILWRIGDKADCRHCHTPIMLSPRRMKDPLAVGEADVPAMWIHKYTDQRTCAVPTMSSDDDEPTHTFAEPSRS